jgi:hypothetical protein
LDIETKNRAVKLDDPFYDDPGEVMAQLRTFAWLLGSMNTESEITENQTFGLYLLANMIGDNVKSMIEKFDSESPPNK